MQTSLRMYSVTLWALFVSHFLLSICGYAQEPDELRTFKEATRRTEAANQLLEQGNVAGAIQAFRDLLAEQRADLDAENQLIARTLNNLSYALSQNDEFDAALAAGLEALDLAKLAGDPSPGTAQVRRNLAGVAERMGDLQQARTWIEEAVRDFQKTFGPTPTTGEAREAAARLAIRLGYLKEAQEHLEWSLAINEKIYGPNHPETTQPMGPLASVLASQGQFDPALLLHEHTLSVLEAVGQIGSQQWFAASGAYLALLRRLGDHYAARPQLEKVMSLLEPVKGQPNTWSVRLQTAGQFLEFGFAEEASALLEEVKGEMSDSTSIPLAETMRAVIPLAFAKAFMGRHSEAIEIADEWIPKLEKEMGGINELSMALQIRRGRSRLAQGDYAAAHADLRPALETIRESFGGTHPKLLEIYLGLLEAELQTDGVTWGLLDLLEMVEGAWSESPPLTLAGQAFTERWASLSDYAGFWKHAQWSAVADHTDHVASGFQAIDRHRERALTSALAWWMDSAEANKESDWGRYLAYLRNAERKAVDKEKREAQQNDFRQLREQVQAGDSRLQSVLLPEGQSIETARELLDGDEHFILAYSWTAVDVWAYLLGRKDTDTVLVNLGSIDQLRPLLSEAQTMLRDIDAPYNLTKLSGALLAPLWQRLEKARKVTIIADGPLAFVPFEALPVAGQGPWLQSCMVSYAPSVAALSRIRSTEGGAGNRLHFGMPAPHNEIAANHHLIRLRERFSTAPAAGPHMPIAEVLPEGEYEQSGPAATESNLANLGSQEFEFVRLQLPTYIDASVPSATALVLAPEPDEGKAAWNREDGLLNLGELHRLNLSARLAWLPMAEVGPEPTDSDLTAEGLHALVHGFWQAGVEGLILSNWTISHPVGELFNRHVLRQTRAGAGSRALWLAQKEWLSKADNDLQKHPAVWARYRYFGR